MVERIQPQGLPTPTAYSPVVKAGNTVYVAGQVSQDEQGHVVGRGDITAQATQVFENIGKALTAAGAGFDDLVKMNVYLTDVRFRDALAPVRSKYLTGPLPVSTLVVVAGLALPDYLLEIEVVAELS
jgi:enamine deaminase RidA (YjgF/YER057c/UK114 family)